VLTKTYAPTPLEPFVQSSSQPSAELRWFGNAAIAFATLAVSALAPATVSAQQAESTHQPGHHVAVIDVAYIFKNLSAIKAQFSKVEGDLKKYGTELKQKRDALKQSAAQLKTLKVGTADYARQEEHFTTLESKLRLDMARKQKELGDAEAKIYYDNYQRIAAAVKAIATHNNIKLVLRFNSEDMDLEQSDSVARGVMKNVVYHDSTINMTNTVMRYLEQQTNTSQVAIGGSAASATNR
jgi:Skp family chaperone for outer membrane proteins